MKIESFTFLTKLFFDHDRLGKLPTLLQNRLPSVRLSPSPSFHEQDTKTLGPLLEGESKGSTSHLFI